MRNVLLATLVLLAGLGIPSQGWAFLEVSQTVPTLGRVVKQATRIEELQVDKVSREKNIILYKKIATLKGNDANEVVKHKLTEGYHPRELHTIREWAEPGEMAICFYAGQGSLTCVGRYWYLCTAQGDSWWIMVAGRPE